MNDSLTVASAEDAHITGKIISPFADKVAANHTANQIA